MPMKVYVDEVFANCGHPVTVAIYYTPKDNGVEDAKFIIKAVNSLQEHLLCSECVRQKQKEVVKNNLLETFHKK